MGRVVRTLNEVQPVGDMDRSQVASEFESGGLCFLEEKIIRIVQVAPISKRRALKTRKKFTSPRKMCTREGHARPLTRTGQGDRAGGRPFVLVAGNRTLL